MTLDPTKWAGIDDRPWVITPKDYGYELGIGSGIWIFELHDHRKPDDITNDPYFISMQDKSAALIAAAPAIEAERVRLDAENARLREALEPFVRVAEWDIAGSESDMDHFRPATSYNRAPILRVRDFRRARAALGGTP
jgi:hypothetical protein